MPTAFDSSPPHTFGMMCFAFSPLVYIALYIVSVIATRRARASEAAYPAVLAWALLPSVGIVGFMICFDHLPWHGHDKICVLGSRNLEGGAACLGALRGQRQIASARSPSVSWLVRFGCGIQCYGVGNPMRLTNSRKRGDERMESNSGAVRMNSIPKLCSSYERSRQVMARLSLLSSAY